MSRIFKLIFRLSFLFIACSILLLVIFKSTGYIESVAAYIVGISSLVGGILLIIGSVGLFLDGTLPQKKDDALIFHLPELLAVGVVFIFAAIIIICGKII